jgi:vancomycin resistance protein VanW
VGRPTKGKGYRDGLEMREGKLTSSAGGGLCQLSNMLHWAAINIGLVVLERHRHGYDLFPDDHRKIPFGTGATVFYNYIDLRIKNNLNQPIVLDFSFTKEEVSLRIISDRKLPYQISVLEKDHKFYEKNGKKFRRNKLVQVYKFPDKTGKEVMALENDSEVRY